MLLTVGLGWSEVQPSSSTDAIVGLLKIYGQGARCYENAEYAGVVYCSGCIIADDQEAWILETAGQHWAAEKVDSKHCSS